MRRTACRVRGGNPSQGSGDVGRERLRGAERKTRPNPGGADRSHRLTTDACRSSGVLHTPVPLLVRPPNPRTTRSGEPLTLGVPFPKGMLADAGAVALIRDARERVHVQTRALARWADGSIQWLLIDFRADIRLDTPTQYFLTQDVETWNSEPISPQVNVAEDTGSVVVDTGAARFVFRRGNRFPFGHATVSDRSHVDGSRSGLEIEDAQGHQWKPQIGHVRIEERGPLRAALFVTAEPEAGREDRPLQCSARLHFFAGLATVRVELTVRNPRRAEHKGGYWELGDAGSVFLRDVSLVLALSSEAGQARVLCSAECGTDLVPTPAPIVLYQDSSGGENWRSTNHLNGRRLLPLTFRGYKFTTGGAQTVGLRATPIVALEQDTCLLAVSSQHFWQDFPKAVEASADSIVLRLWPRQTADDHEIQGGEQKTHAFYVAFGADPVVPRRRSIWGRSPSAASATPSWYCHDRRDAISGAGSRGPRRTIPRACRRRDRRRRGV